MRNRLFVLVTAAAIGFGAGMTRAEEPSRGDATPLPPAARSTGDSTLVGRHVAVDVGAIVELPSDINEGQLPAARDVALGGARFTELSGAGQEAPLLVPAPNTQIEGDPAAVDSDVFTVRRHSRAGRGALIGAGVGLAAGIGLVIMASHATDTSDGERLQLSAIGAVILLAVPSATGALIGAAGGAMTHTERQERVDRRKLSVAVMPDPRGGVRGRLAVRF